jgi:hypothetical protein
VKNPNPLIFCSDPNPLPVPVHLFVTDTVPERIRYCFLAGSEYVTGRFFIFVTDTSKNPLPVLFVKEPNSIIFCSDPNPLPVLLSVTDTWYETVNNFDVSESNVPVLFVMNPNPFFLFVINLNPYFL